MAIEDYSKLHGLLGDALSETKPMIYITKTDAPGSPVVAHTVPAKKTTKVKAVDSTNSSFTGHPTPNPSPLPAPTTDIAPEKATGERNPSIWDFLNVPYRAVTASILTGGEMYQYLTRAGGHLFDFSPQGNKIVNTETNRFNKGVGDAWSSQFADFGYNDADKAKLKADDVKKSYPEYDYSGLTDQQIADAAEAQGLHHNLDIGTAVQYNLGQLVNLGMSVIPDLTDSPQTPINSNDDAKVMATFDKGAADWGFVGGNINFDPFSDKQRALIVGNKFDENGNLISQGNGWTLGNVTVQASNLVGDIATDPITYIPVANLVKGGMMLARGSRYLPNIARSVSLGGIIARDAGALVKIAELPEAANLVGRYTSKKAAQEAAGEKLHYWDFAKFAATNTADTIIKHPVIKSIPSSERNQVAWLLGEVKTEQDVAKVLLATDYNSTKAFSQLVAKDANLSLALDEINGGGYLIRQANKGLMNDPVLDSVDNKSFYDLINHYSDQLNGDDFSRILTETMVKSSSEGLSMGATAARQLLPSTSALTNQINNFGAHLGSYIAHANVWEGSTILSRALTKFGSGKIFHQVVRPFTTTAKGIINVEDANGMAGDKFFGMIGDIDRLSNGSLSKEVLTNGKTLRQDLTQKWMKATTPQSRADLIHYVQEVGLTRIAEKHLAGLGGVEANKELIQKIVAGLNTKQRIHLNNLGSRGLSVIKEVDADGKIIGEHIFSDPYLVGQTANNIPIWEWNKIGAAFAKEGTFIKSGLYRLSDMVSNVQRTVNSVWQQVLLLRPARIMRDIYQNIISTNISGYGGDIVKGNLELVKDIVKNVTSKDRLTLGTIPKWKDRFTILSHKSSPKEYRDGISILEEERDNLQEAFSKVIGTSVNAIAKGNLEKLSFKDLLAHAENAKELQSETHYHASTHGAVMADGTASTRLDTRSIPVFKKEEEAKDFLASKGETFGAIDPAKTLKLPDGPGITRMVDPTVGKISSELGDGKIVQIRGRKDKPWSLIDLKTLANQTDANIAKYEVRVVSGDALTDVLSRKEIADLLTQGNHVWYKDGSTEWLPLNTESLKGIPEILPKGATVKVFRANGDLAPINAIVPIKTYGETLTITSDFKDIKDTNLATILGINSQKDLDEWLSTKVYDQLGAGTRVPGVRVFPTMQPKFDNPGIWNTLTNSSIGRLEIKLVDGSTTWVANPILADVPFFDGAKYIYRTSQAPRLIQAELEKMGITQSDLAEFTRIYDVNLGLGDIFTSADQKFRDIAEKIRNSIANTHSKLPKEIEQFINTSKSNAKKFSGDPLNQLHAALGVDRTSLLATTDAVKTRLVQVNTLIQELEERLIKSNRRLETKAAQVKAGKIVKVQSSTGDIDIQGNKFSNALAGDSGHIAMSQLRKDAKDARVFDAHKPYGGTTEKTVVKPTDPQYWEAWANTLNRDFQFNGSLDPVIKGIIKGFKQGLSEEEIKASLKDFIENDLRGKKYANAIGVGNKYEYPDLETLARPDHVRTEGTSVETFLDENIWNVQNHIGQIPSDDAVDEGVTISNEIAEMLLKGETITPEILAEARLGGQFRLDNNYGTKSLPDIWASKTNSRYKSELTAKVAKTYESYRTVITESSQVYMFQTPMFDAAYRRSLNEQIERFKISNGFKRDEEVKIGDAQRVQMEKRARASALDETRKWVYSSKDNSLKIEDALRFIVPFANAQLFTLRSLYRGLTDQPLRLARMVYFLNKANSSIKWIDKNGNPVGFEEKDTDGKKKAVATQTNLPPFVVDAINNIFGFGNAGLKNGKGEMNLTWSRASLDPVFQGNFGKNLFGIGPEVGFDTPNPFNGFSLLPSPAIALSEWTKNEADNPNSITKWLTDTFPQLQPYGPSDKPTSLDILIPGGLGQAVWDIVNQNQGKWQKAVLNTAQFLTGEMLNGNYSVPKGSTFEEELNKHAGNLFWLQTLSNFFSPVSTSYNTAGDMAGKTWRNYLDVANTVYDKDLAAWKAQYGDQTPFTVAQGKFLTEHPDLFYASVRQNDRKYQQNVSAGALGNIRKYKPILDEVLNTQQSTGLSDKYTKETLRFLVNEDWNKPTSAGFDQTVWNTMISEGYVSKVTPEEIQKEVLLAKANQMYWGGFDVVDSNGKTVHIYGKDEIDNLSQKTGVMPDGSSAYDAQQRLNRTIQRDPNVGSTYSELVVNPDPQKYSTNAKIWNKIMFGDNGQGDVYATWWKDHTDQGSMGLPLVNDVTDFLNYRTGIEKQLTATGNKTGVYRLSAYPQLQTRYETRVAIMRQNNPQFDQWFHTFFEGDTIY